MMRLGTVLQCMVALAIYDVMSAFRVSPTRLDETIPCRRTRRHEPEEKEVLDILDRVAAWYWHPVKCLQRSVVGTWLLRRRGCPAELVIGYRPRPIEGHAWIQVGDTVVNDLPTYPRHFRTVYRSGRT